MIIVAEWIKCLLYVRLMCFIPLNRYHTLRTGIIILIFKMRKMKMKDAN